MMQRFSCPFCGPRDETEFFYGGEAGNERPEPAENISPVRWAQYLHMEKNEKGRAREIWVHLTCGEFFVMERDTVTHEIFKTEAFHGERT
ncbi:sarcosine oxidase subunit delta [Fodinicurvata fenggangensis]|uniref:sarcosine oxidase subunit delta n=1 Tax=Fodinicurvata fenggangensis TaxID=1121830 RepID=UPI001B80AD56|nr:sarcosine oxidase subunit delta [Fodinicurvata fenggangensis]